jgi:hypothetical protein
MGTGRHPWHPHGDVCIFPLCYILLKYVQLNQSLCFF